MAHEIERLDHVALTRKRAWHGLGTVVQDAPTPREALELARLNWTVEQWPLSATNGERRLIVSDSVLNVRVGTGPDNEPIAEPLGVVGAGYQPIQNSDLAEFCEALAEQGDEVRIETAGSIRNGRKVWFLIRGSSFSTIGDDEIAPYILVSNGHDGSAALRCTPTTIRVVCSNTLHMVIPQSDKAGGIKCLPRCFAARHSGDVHEKVEQAKQALGLYRDALDDQRELIDTLANKDVSHSDVQQFFTDAYQRDFGAIPSNPRNKSEARARDKATEAYTRYISRFQRESEQFKPSAWLSFNAYSQWLQHERPVRAANPTVRAERRQQYALFGVDADRTVNAFAQAMSMAS